MTLRKAVQTLVVLTLALPVVALVLVWAAGLLRAMGDTTGASVIGYVGVACQVVWSVCLMGLLITLAILVTNDVPPKEAPPQDEDSE